MNGTHAFRIGAHRLLRISENREKWCRQSATVTSGNRIKGKPPCKATALSAFREMGQTGSILAYLFFTFFPDQLLSKLPVIDTDLTGRTYLVTGSNTGLGLAAAIHLARLKASRIVLAVRDLNKGAKAKEEIIAQTNFAGIIDVWELDMSKFNSVKGFVERTNRELKRLDGAIINAGIPNPLRRETTEDGWEKLYAFISSIGSSLALMFYFSLQVNAIATGLLSVLLLPLLQATAKLSQEASHLTLTGSAGTFPIAMPLL